MVKKFPCSRWVVRYDSLESRYSGDRAGETEVLKVPFSSGFSQRDELVLFNCVSKRNRHNWFLTSMLSSDQTPEQVSRLTKDRLGEISRVQS